MHTIAYQCKSMRQLQPHVTTRTQPQRTCRTTLLTPCSSSALTTPTGTAPPALVEPAAAPALLLLLPAAPKVRSCTRWCKLLWLLAVAAVAFNGCGLITDEPAPGAASAVLLLLRPFVLLLISSSSCSACAIKPAGRQTRMGCEHKKRLSKQQCQQHCTRIGVPSNTTSHRFITSNNSVDANTYRCMVLKQPALCTASYENNMQAKRQYLKVLPCRSAHLHVQTLWCTAHPCQTQPAADADQPQQHEQSQQHLLQPLLQGQLCCCWRSRHRRLLLQVLRRRLRLLLMMLVVPDLRTHSKVLPMPSGRLSMKQ